VHPRDPAAIRSRHAEQITKLDFDHRGVKAKQGQRPQSAAISIAAVLDWEDRAAVDHDDRSAGPARRGVAGDRARGMGMPGPIEIFGESEVDGVRAWPGIE
jgi:hypothetical protein